MSSLNGKLAVITGGNSGIGYASAKKLKENGATVIITGRSTEKVKIASEELGVQGIVTDVKDLSAIDHLVEKVKNESGNVDILFVNAGVFAPAPIGQISEEGFDNEMSINFKGAVFTLEKFFPILNEGASVINLGSINAYAGIPNMAVYSASKAALNSFTRTAAVELAQKNIRVNVINPGPVSTPIFEKTGMPADQLQEFAELIHSKIPMNRFGEPEEIANLVSFLASDEASFITGSEYNADGGISINSLL